MLFTRRTFMQSSLAASLTVAADATGAGWLLNPDHPVRIAIAGLGPAAEEHISLFAALPGARIVALADSSHTRHQAAIAQIAALGNPRPSVHSSVSDLLRHTAVDAISLPFNENSSDYSLHEILATRLPILIDLPPRNLSHGELTALQEAPIHFRATDRVYPGAPGNIRYRWKRHSPQPEIDPQKRSARLILERRLSPPQLRAVFIAALRVVLEPISTSAAALSAWSKDPTVIEFARASTVLHIYLPPQISNFDSLEVDLLPRSSGASIISLDQPQRSMQFPIWKEPDSQSSLRTVMSFLSQTRACSAKRTSPTRTRTTDKVTDATLTFAAAFVVDRAVTFEHRK